MTTTPDFQASFTSTFTSISEQIANHGYFRAREIALIEGNRSLDWAGYDAIGNQIGHALVAAGVQKGQRVALLLVNSLWSHELLLGIWRAGAVPVPLSPMLTAAALSTMIADCGARLLFASTAYTDLAKNALGASDIDLIDEGEAFLQFTSGASSESIDIALTADDLAVIIYSSGTTGQPKGIVHDHGARAAFARGLAAEFRFHYHSVTLSSIPIHSNGAWLGWLPGKMMGATTVVLPQFTPDAFFDLVRKHRPTHGFIVPTMCAALLDHPGIENAGLECFEAAITAGAPMPDRMKQEMRRLTQNGLYELWGLTEGVATIIGPEDMAKRPNAVGRPIIGSDIRLIDDQDRDITFKGVGEIVGNSGSIMSGYWNRPDANAELVWKDEHGTVFIRTGDIGEFDADGFLTLKGRARDLIISGGLNVFPVDIESILLTHEAVRDATVIGVEHPRWGETPVAFVILREDVAADAGSMRAWANEKLAKHQRLHDLVIHAGDFPRNTLGKVLKNELAEAYAQGL